MKKNNIIRTGLGLLTALFLSASPIIGTLSVMASESFAMPEVQINTEVLNITAKQEALLIQKAKDNFNAILGIELGQHLSYNINAIEDTYTYTDGKAEKQVRIVVETNMKEISYQADFVGKDFSEAINFRRIRAGNLPAPTKKLESLASMAKKEISTVFGVNMPEGMNLSISGYVDSENKAIVNMQWDETVQSGKSRMAFNVNFSGIEIDKESFTGTITDSRAINCAGAEKYSAASKKAFITKLGINIPDNYSAHVVFGKGASQGVHVEWRLNDLNSVDTGQNNIKTITYVTMFTTNNFKGESGIKSTVCEVNEN